MKNRLTNAQAKKVAVNTCNKELDEISKIKQISKNFREIFINFVEKNNGWIRIEPDGSNLPELGTKWKWFDAGNNLIEMSTMDCKETFLENYTHYKETEVDYRPKY